MGMSEEYEPTEEGLQPQGLICPCANQLERLGSKSQLQGRLGIYAGAYCWEPAAQSCRSFSPHTSHSQKLYRICPEK